MVKKILHIAFEKTLHCTATKVLFLFIAASFGSYSQELHFTNLSEKVQIPASETYNIIQDSSGFIWFATEEGYCRYSKGSIDVFDERYGIPEKAVYAAGIDEKGKLYVVTRKRRILFFDGKKFVQSRYCDAYIEATKVDWSYPSSIRFAGNNIYIQEHTRTVIINRPTGGITQYKQADGLIRCKVVQKNVVLFEAWRCTHWNKRIVEFDLNNRVTRLPVPHHTGNSNSMMCATWRNRTAFSLSKEIWVFENGRPIGHTLFPNRILSLNFDSSGNLLIGFLNNGLHWYTDANVNSTPLISLKRLSVSGILVTGDGSTWCTTLEGGVQFCQNPRLTDYRNIPGLNSRILLLTRCDGKVLCASNEHAIYDIHPTGVIPFVKFTGQERFTDVVRTGPVYLLTSTEASQRLFPFTGNRLNLRRGKNNVSAYTAFHAKNQTILLNTDVLYDVSPDFKQIDIIHRFTVSKPKNGIRLNDSVCLVFGENLLLTYNLRTRVSHLGPQPDLDFNAGILSSDGTVYLTTKYTGIYRYISATGRLQRVYMFASKQAILSIDQDKNGRFWIGTNTGALLIEQDWRRITDIGKLEALPGTETRMLRCSGDKVYLGTNQGLFSLPTNLSVHRFNIYPPRLDYFINKGKKYEVFHSDGWFGDITLKLLIPPSGSESAVFYVLSDGSPSHPVRLEGDKVTFSQLQPGTYNFSVYLTDKFGNRSRTLTYSFVIRAHFYQTWWFAILSGVFFLLLISFAFSRTIKIISKREARKTEINTQLAEFQMSALQAQMNPHFIFNAINTIQSYILTKNKDDAYRYLTKFSTLIRLVLHNSQEKFIPLVEELEVIHTYLELEQARFSNFTYRVDVHPDIDICETMVPAMLVQPYLENAIWHGLGHLNERLGQLTLTFSITQNCLQIEIRDNGIGREAAAKHKRSSHKSAGTSITQQRLATLAQLNEGGVATVEVVDLIENGAATGTLVIIKVSLPENV